MDEYAGFLEVEELLNQEVGYARQSMRTLQKSDDILTVLDQLEELSKAFFAHPMGEALFERYRALPQARIGNVTRGVVLAAALSPRAAGWAAPDRVRPLVLEALRRTWARLAHELRLAKNKLRAEERRKKLEKARQRRVGEARARAEKQRRKAGGK